MRSKEIVAAIRIVVGFCLLVGLPAWGAIDRGAIQGTVTDAQGAVVPNVEVEVINTDTNIFCSIFAMIYYFFEKLQTKFIFHKQTKKMLYLKL